MATWAKKMGTAKSVLSTVGSLAATAMVARTIFNDFLPDEVHDYLTLSLRTLFNRFFSPNDMTVVIEELDGFEINQIFEAAQLYLGSRAKSSLFSSATTIRSLKASKPESETTIRITMDWDQETIDDFEGSKFKWILLCHQIETPRNVTNSTTRTEARSYSLTFDQKDKAKAIEQYLPYVLKEAELLKQATRTLKMFTAEYNSWNSINLNHPATFETLAMDSERKRLILDDLERFVRRKDYYRRVGKAWKRGYLLYGPPGTGKSSLIAAMANYLNFDIYDLQLSELNSDLELRTLLLGTANKSILVVEDIDCSVEFKDRESTDTPTDDHNPESHHERKVTLSGLLNFVDGLWSSCGEERIIIFTTNHKDKLDPALLRPGRMDMRILMSYCTPSGFKVFASNYLGIKHHQLFEEIELLIEDVNVTPAEVAEQLMKHDEPDPALAELLDFLKKKKVENAENRADKLVIKTESAASDGQLEEPSINNVDCENTTQSS